MAKKKTESSSEINEQLEEIAQSSRGIISNISEIIWAINPNNDSLDNLVSYLNHYASKFMEGTSINYKFCAPENFPDLKLTSEQRRNVFLTLKEALNNAVKYSEADLVILEIGMSDSAVFISIKDNGKGFCVEEKKFGNGLTNMKKRIEEFMEVFQSVLRRDKGTTVQIQFGR